MGGRTCRDRRSDRRKKENNAEAIPRGKVAAATPHPKHKILLEGSSPHVTLHLDLMAFLPRVCRSPLDRLRKCLELSLASNELDSLAGVTLPACRELHLSSNRFASFKVRRETWSAWTWYC